MPDWSQPDFEWDEGNIQHIIDRHDVYPDEVEQVFYSGAYVIRAGDSYRVLGQDDAGRYLVIICKTRGSVVRVITARNITARERRFYERNR